MKRPDGLPTKHRPLAALLALVAALAFSGCAARTLDLPRDASLRPQFDRFGSALEKCAPASRSDDRRRARVVFERALTAAKLHSIYVVDPDALASSAIAGLGACDAPNLSPLQETDRALASMVTAFDPDGDYLPPADYAKLWNDPEVAGLGLELIVRDNALLVVAPLPGSPAARAGVTPRDRLLAIDGWSVDASNLEGAVSRLQGPPFSEVSLTVQSGQHPSRILHLQREIAHYPAVWSSDSSRDPEGYASVRLRLLTDRSSIELFHELNRLAPLRGLVLDLRSNSGGLLSQAVAVADLFLASTLIARTDARATESDKVYVASGTARWSTLPIVVLVDERTAAGAEIIAAALQHKGRAKVMGTHTRGVGTVRSIFPLGEKRALELTTSQIYTAGGEPLALGIDPDIVASEKVDVLDLHTDADTVLAKARKALRVLATTGGESAATPLPTRPSAP